jgi:hypothetical protein
VRLAHEVIRKFPSEARACVRVFACDCAESQHAPAGWRWHGQIWFLGGRARVRATGLAEPSAVRAEGGPAQRDGGTCPLYMSHVRVGSELVSGR